MITLHGTSVNKGIAIAEAAIVGPGGDLSDLPTDLLQRGIQALKRSLPDDEKPQVVVIAESLEDGLAIRLPGIKVAAVAAQDSPNGGICSVPCVAEIADLMRSVTNGAIVIVDGTKGAIYVDPDVDSLVHYQSLEESQKTKRVFLESVHLPAITQDGKTILVFAIAGHHEEARAALEEGADAIFFNAAAVRAIAPTEWAELLRDSGGKAFFLAASPDDDALGVIMAESLPLQVTIALPSTNLQVVHDMAALLGRIADEIISEDTEPAEIALGILVDPTAEMDTEINLSQFPRLFLDATVCEISPTQSDLADCISEVLTDVSSDGQAIIPTTIILADSIDGVRHLISDAVDSVAVPAGAIAATKDLIRSFPTQD